jgi:hypothetical protein
MGLVFTYLFGTQGGHTDVLGLGFPPCLASKSHMKFKFNKEGNMEE